MMQFVFTYDDIEKWLHNFFDLGIKAWAYNDKGGEFVIKVPEVGMCKLLPKGFRHYQQYYTIDDFDATSVTLFLFSIGGTDEVINRLIVRFFNSCLGSEVLEQLPRGQVKLHLDKMHLTHTIQLHNIQLTEEGLKVEFADDAKLLEQLRMIQLFLRAGYTRINVIPEDMGYTGYWFSDGTLDYTLVTADHPADMRMWTSFPVMEWLGFEGKIPLELLQPTYPNEKIRYQYGNITVVIPLTIAEPEINKATLERNCNRLQSEVSCLITALLYYNHKDKNTR